MVEKEERKEIRNGQDPKRSVREAESSSRKQREKSMKRKGVRLNDSHDQFEKKEKEKEKEKKLGVR